MNSTEFSRLMQQYQGLVYTVCFQLVRDPDTAQDLAQETFLAAWIHQERCPPGCEKQWLARIAANKAKDHLKSAYQRRVNLPGDEGMPELPAPGAPPGPPGPEDEVLSSLGYSDLAALVHELREPYLKVSELFFLQERTVEEIALALCRPAKTVRTQLYRARHILQEQIQRKEHGNHGTL